MKKNGTHAFVNQLLLCLLVTICFGGSIGLGTVWTRHQISIVANRNRALGKEISKLEEKISAKTAEIFKEQTPEVLRRRNVAMRLGLIEVKDTQIVRVPADPVRQLAARRNSELLREPPAANSRFAALER
ncbi:MAG: hypothetical protein ABIZ49_03470 [Opitutaceae bacterium]